MKKKAEGHESVMKRGRRSANQSPKMSSKDSPKSFGGILRHFVGLQSGQLLVALSVVAVAARCWVGDFRWADALIVLGVLIVWPFFEWAIHSFALHLEARDIGPLSLGPVRVPKFRLDMAVARTHRAHHLNPWQLDHVMIPLYTYYFSIPANLLLWFALFEPARALTGVAMVVLLGLHYELVHLMAHCRWKPPIAYYRRLWRNHRLHHCKSEKHWMGVTMLLGDVVLGTGGHPKDIETSPTCRTLGQEEVVRVDA